ncbi:tail assembly protein, partial [Salmonella enterica subsp. enterica serovar Newport]|nr:tail assembly protein [Salmonella enterica subsp. enterica serovar Newport]
MATTYALHLATPGMARICLYGDLQRFGRRFSLSIKTGAEAIYALAMQVPGFRQKLNDGWYHVRIAGNDVTADTLTTSLHDPLPPG